MSRRRRADLHRHPLRLPVTFYVKWPKLRVWHVERIDGHTVCGLIIGKNVLRADSIIGERRAPRLCKQCERMRDADTMRPLVRK